MRLAALLLLFTASPLLLATRVPDAKRPPQAPKKASAKKPAPQPSPAPKSEVKALLPESPLVDLGKIPTGKKAPFQVVLTNHSQEPLTLKTVSPACGCTTVALPSERTVPAGGRLALDMTFDPHGYFGKISRNIEFTTTSTERPAFTVWVAAEVDAFCLPQPKLLLLLSKVGESTTQEFRFVPMTKGIDAASVTPEGDPDLTKRLKVEWAAAPGGEVKGRVTFSSTEAMTGTSPREVQLVLRTKDGQSEYVRLLLDAR